jgi:YD repeat-containing protein
LQIVRDRYGNETRYDYDSTGNLFRITDPVGLETYFVYSGNHVSQIIDPAGRITTLSYNGSDLVGVTDPDNSQRAFDYDAKGHLTAEVNKFGGIEVNTYGFHGRATEARRPDNTVITVSALQVQGLSDPALNPATKEHPAPVQTVKLTALKAYYTQANGNQRVVTLNERGQVMEVNDQLGLLERFVRNGDGYVIEATDEAGHVTFSTYDNRGNTLTIRDGESPPGVATVMTYDAVFNQLSSYTDELGHTTRYTINAHGDNILTVQADNTEWHYDYLPQGMLRMQTDPLGHQIKYAYDGYGRLEKMTNADGTSRSYEYDLAGNTAAIIDELGHRTTFTYDGMNHDSLRRRRQRNRVRRSARRHSQKHL